MTGVGKLGDDAAAGSEARRAVVAAELERLRRVLVETMNGLAEQVLDQIQATRDAVDHTESLLDAVRGSDLDGHGAIAAPELHLYRAIGLIEEAMRDMPEDSWDDFARTCIHLARTISRLQGRD